MMLYTISGRLAREACYFNSVAQLCEWYHESLIPVRVHIFHIAQLNKVSSNSVIRDCTALKLYGRALDLSVGPVKYGSFNHFDG